MESKFLRLDSKDVLRGFIVAAFCGGLVTLQGALTNGTEIFSAEFGESLLRYSISAGVAYLMKNLITDQDGKILGKV